jgi:hypothetical protein
MTDLDDVLQHYGVKGMKWGVHKKSSSGSSGPEPVSVRAEAGKKIKTSGGKGHGPAGEAIDTAVARQKAKKSKVQSLSNKELQDAVRRMQLEQQFSQLSSQGSTIAGGKKLVKELLGLGKTANEVQAFSNSPAGKSLKDQLAAASK